MNRVCVSAFFKGIGIEGSMNIFMEIYFCCIYQKKVNFLNVLYRGIIVV